MTTPRTGMTVDALRAFVLSMTGAEEKSHHGKADFRYRNKIVVNLDETAETITIKMSVEDQAALVALDPEAFTLPGGWAKHGWTTISLRLANKDDITELVDDAWQTATG